MIVLFLVNELQERFFIGNNRFTLLLDAMLLSRSVNQESHGWQKALEPPMQFANVAAS